MWSLIKCSWSCRGHSSCQCWTPGGTCGDTSHSEPGGGQRSWQQYFILDSDHNILILLVDKSFQTRSPVLNEILLKYSIIIPEWKLSLDCFARQRRNNNLHNNEIIFINTWSVITLLSLSSSFLSHSKSEYLLRTLDSLTRKTGRLVYIKMFCFVRYNMCIFSPWV